MEETEMAHIYFETQFIDMIRKMKGEFCLWAVHCLNTKGIGIPLKF